jgi:hypothetical protein
MCNSYMELETQFLKLSPKTLKFEKKGAKIKLKTTLRTSIKIIKVMKHQRFS